MKRQHDRKPLFQSPAPDISEATRRIIRDTGLPEDLAVHIERYLRRASHMREILPEPVRGRAEKQTLERFTSMKSAAKRLTALLKDEHLLSQMISLDDRARSQKSLHLGYTSSGEKSTLTIKKRLHRDIKGVEDILVRANKISEELKNKPKQALRKNAAKVNRGHRDDLFIGFWRRWVGEKIEFRKGSKFVRVFDSTEKEINGKAWRCPHLDTLKARFARFCWAI